MLNSELEIAERALTLLESDSQVGAGLRGAAKIGLADQSRELAILNRRNRLLELEKQRLEVGSRKLADSAETLAPATEGVREAEQRSERALAKCRELRRLAELRLCRAEAEASKRAVDAESRIDLLQARVHTLERTSRDLGLQLALEHACRRVDGPVAASGVEASTRAVAERFERLVGGVRLIVLGIVNELSATSC